MKGTEILTTIGNLLEEYNSKEEQTTIANNFEKYFRQIIKICEILHSIGHREFRKDDKEYFISDIQFPNPIELRMKCDDGTEYISKTFHTLCTLQDFHVFDSVDEYEWSLSYVHPDDLGKLLNAVEDSQCLATCDTIGGSDILISQEEAYYLPAELEEES